MCTTSCAVGMKMTELGPLLTFMIQFYGNEKLHEAVGDIVKEVCIDADKRKCWKNIKFLYYCYHAKK